MAREFQEKLDGLKEYLKKLEYLTSSIALIQWDSIVNMPSKAVEYRSEILGYLSGESYKISTSKKIKQYIDFFSNSKNLDDITKGTIKKISKDYIRNNRIPKKEYKQYIVAGSISGAAWEEAKKKSDFKIFQPHLKKMVEYNQKFADYWGFKKNRYDALLDIYEPGITTEKLDKVFGNLRDAIVQLLNKIKESGNSPDIKFLKGNFPKDAQEEFAKKIMGKMGYDFKEAGRIDESTHPFTTNFGNKDVRITTHYYENDFRPALFSFIHEAGHAIYEQDIPDTLQGTLLAQGASMGIHESQSRFYENIIGKSKYFWDFFYSEALERFPQFKDISLEDFYRGINFVEPSLIRTEADELTYSLHIIIRYEIEKLLINGDISVEDLPNIWNEKYKEYLGVEPKNDAEGVLQDIHWSDGSFGYFPSYALGNLYGTQFLNKMKIDIPDIYEKISQGNLTIVHEWLNENIHKYGAIYKPTELIKRVTGEELSEKYFIEYLNKKFKKIYNIN
ncbi:carboxypeptidase M32 [Clostridium pasteurianum]|uniref:Metal-dependent carboxypeptidase n=1 Tax=Clostridium pasteurianum BC1 TaxID=86416 RepID=R4K096_CLOPA|nr:carboxypeptidase M32 [Clostridium pasteurianum]AGK95211.1 Zn-dependent carboxypeptidase [Clostridium pasteurianum BC1]